MGIHRLPKHFQSYFYHNCVTKTFFDKMKLSLVFMTAVVAQKKKKLHTPEKQLEKLKDHIEAVWIKWYDEPCPDARKARFNRFQDFVDRLLVQYESCGFFDEDLPNGGPPVEGYRKRRDDGEEGQEDKDEKEDMSKEDADASIADLMSDYESDGSAADPRMKLHNMNKANKQLGNIVKRFGERYLTLCTHKLTSEKVVSKGKQWTNRLNNMKCVGGPGGPN